MFSDDKRNPGVLVAERKSKKDGAEEMKWLVIIIAESGKLIRGDESLPPADWKDIGPYEVRTCARIQDRAKGTQSSMIDPKRRGDELVRLLHCENEAIVREEVHLFSRDAICHQQASTIQREIDPVILGELLGRMKTMTRNTEVMSARGSGELPPPTSIEL